MRMSVMCSHIGLRGTTIEHLEGVSNIVGMLFEIRHDGVMTLADIAASCHTPDTPMAGPLSTVATIRSQGVGLSIGVFMIPTIGVRAKVPSTIDDLFTTAFATCYALTTRLQPPAVPKSLRPPLLQLGSSRSATDRWVANAATVGWDG